MPLTVIRKIKNETDIRATYNYKMQDVMDTNVQCFM